MTRQNIKIGIIQQACTASIEDNRARIQAKILNLAQQGADLIALQELHDSLYFCQTEDPTNFDLAQPIPGQASEFYSDIAKEANVIIVASLFEKRTIGLYHNTAVVFDTDGTIAGTYRKMHIPDDPAYYEKFYFTPGDIGFKPIDTSLGRIGVLICWDQWYPEAARLMALAGAEILIYPTAIGWETSDTDDEKQRQIDAWVSIQRSHAIANGIHVVAVNRVGFEPDPSGATAGIDFWGSSFVAGPQGELLFQASPKDEQETLICIDTNRTEQVRRIWPFLRDRRIDAYGQITQRLIDLD